MVVSLGLSGCFGVPVSSLPRLMRLDFLTMDFNEVRAGLRLPAMLALRPGDATMSIKTRAEGRPETVDRFVLVETTAPAERAGLAGQARPGFALSVWRVDPNDVPRLAAIQALGRDSRTSGPRIRGSVEIRVAGGCARSAIPDGPVRISSFLKPAREESFITLTEDTDLRAAIAAADWQDKVPRCAG
ncbi:hypothetical protein E8M01_01480 [Phreatobacter stygius]|uniref:Uncharacterized protein n=2 Tax=Phreatobacter stygius TaxID=1940610 RepID=A0A4D7BIY2_9HYPH|nr:hypothetical protein E8M01_01480 [Phreatobacter stygius]